MEQKRNIIPTDNDRTHSNSIRFDVGAWSQLAIAEVQWKLCTQEQKEAITRLALRMQKERSISL